MARQLTIEVDKSSLRELDRAILRYAAKRKKDIPDVVNRAAMNVAFRAAQFTPKTTKSKILSGIDNPHALARWIYKNRGPFKNAPQDPKTKDEWQQVTDKLIAVRLASIAFIRAGWLPGAKKLRALVRKGKADIKSRSLRRGREGFGDAQPARFALQAFALIFNRSYNPKNATSVAALQQQAGPAAEKAVRYVAADMLRFIKEPFDKGALEFNRKK